MDSGARVGMAILAMIWGLRRHSMKVWLTSTALHQDPSPHGLPDESRHDVVVLITVAVMAAGA